MNLVAAQDRAIAALEKTFDAPPWTPAGDPPLRPKVYVDRHSGAINDEEMKRMAGGPQPRVWVAVIGRGDDGARIAVYVTGRVKDDRTVPMVQVVDAVESTLRSLLGTGRVPLETRSQNLYNATVGSAGASLWGVTVSLPSLIGDAPASTGEGLLSALDALLGQYLGWRWGSTERERELLLLDGPLPFALVTYGADSEVAKGSSSVYRYRREGTTYERATLGRREVTAQVELLGRTEEEVETELDRLLAQIPRTWTYEGLTLPVHVRRVVGSHWKRKEGAHATVAEVRLQAPVPQGEERAVQTRTMQGRTQCASGFQPAPAPPPVVTTNGGGSGAVVQSIGVDSEGRIGSVQWSARGSGHAAGDRLVFAQGAILGRWTLRPTDAAAGELQDLAITLTPIPWVEEGRLRSDVQPEEDE
ncbi:MAG: hypothetical protein OXC31_26595 [Spirochaetaceae bacterium]|nr:hypothetical protein [Spirochaetaceae bacterium]